MEKIIDYLLQNAGEIIQYRLRGEVLQIDPELAEMKLLHERILSKPGVRKILRMQRADGWIGNTLHGVPPEGLDSDVWMLLNYGVDKGHPIFQNVIHALLNPREGEPYKRTFPGGPALDLDGRGGDRSVVAKVLASLDCEDNEPVAQEVNLSLEHFRGALEHGSIDDFTATTRTGSRRYYKPKAMFPGSNHIGLLSATSSWRTTENIRMVKNSFVHCLGLMKGESQGVYFKSDTHFVVPFNFSWQRFGFSMDQLKADSYAFVWWLRMLHNLSTFGFVREIPELVVEYEYLKELLDNREIVTKQIEKSLERYRQIWSIEDSWRRDARIQCDLIFTALLVLSRAGF